MKNYYDEKYFDWQRDIGSFGGWANRTKFESYISPGDRVLDFGGGGGILWPKSTVPKRGSSR